jgi:NAD(P)-dependent dehydrogenase (short-subunit alcohol dehydrogenase family)/acyl-CoA thioesterase FadM/3-hydroxymyristoyl/3-hydroxydecanoyl-(acyl carrier protein) dehydratase
MDRQHPNASTMSGLTCVVWEAGDEPVAAALRTALEARGDDVKAIGFDGPAASLPCSAKPVSTLVAILPRFAAETDDEAARLRRVVERFQLVLSLLPRDDVAEADFCLAWVQFGGGRFGTGPEPADPEQACAAALARTLHLERPKLRIRVIDVANTLDPDRMAALILQELSGPAAFQAAGYTAEGVRLTPRAQLQQPARYTPRPFAWGADDVILVTGGGKGITAECAYALGQATRARIALVGSSPVPEPSDGEPSELEQTLARFEAAGLSHRYFPCDLTQPEAVRGLVERVRREFGPITGVVHGAAVNRPRRLGQADTDEVLAEVAPKLLGAQHLCAALSAAPPKLFIGLTSVLGVTGLPGSGWYAFSNEALDLVLRQFAAAHGTAVLSIAFSVWGEIGMGARLDRVAALRRRGIEPIPTEEGVRRFLRLFHCDPGHRQVVVTGNLGGLATWPAPFLAALPGLRFVERVIAGRSGIELFARTRLTFERDPYLKDHVFNGSPLFPAVFGLEAMAQAAAALVGEPAPAVVRFEDVRLERPIVVDSPAGTEIELRASAREEEAGGEQHVRVQIRSEQTGFAVDHFAATLVLGTLQPGPPVPLPNSPQPLPIDPQTELYGDLLFQGPLFQKIEQVLELVDDHAVLAARPGSEGSPDWRACGAGPEGRFLLGDPFLRDALLQTGQLTIPRQVCLPRSIERIERFAQPARAAGRTFLFAPSKVRRGDEVVTEVFSADEHGRVLEKITGYHLHTIRERPEYPTAAELGRVEARDEELLRSALDQALPAQARRQVAVALGRVRRVHSLPREERRRLVRPFVERAARTRLGLSPEEGCPVTLDWLPSGKPRLAHAGPTELGVSVAHDDHTCLCVVAAGQVGCDWTPIRPRSREDWTALLGTARLDLLDQLISGGDTLDMAATRIWSAVEALRKATQAQDVALAFVCREHERVFLRAENLTGAPMVFTLPVQLTLRPQRLIALAVEGLEPEARESSAPVRPTPRAGQTAQGINPDWHCVSVAEDGPQGQPVQQLRFPVSFQEASGVSRRVPASRYPFWMGKIRELVTTTQLPELVEQIATGQWGLVTNWADVRILGEATANDVLQLRFWTLPARGAEVEFCCDFWKLLTEDRFERVAYARQKATWVRLVGHGQVVPENLPAYLADYINRMGPRTAQAAPLPALPEPLAGLCRPTPHAAGGESPARPVLAGDTIQTTFAEANLVGNVYFANYFTWQERLRDLFLHHAAPEVGRDAGKAGEPLCLECRMDYLREAMPFDRIEVVLSARAVEESRAVLGFDYFKLLPDGVRQKISVGRQDVVWVRRGRGGAPGEAPFPEVILQALSAGRRTGDRLGDGRSRRRGTRGVAADEGAYR